MSTSAAQDDQPAGSPDDSRADSRDVAPAPALESLPLVSLAGGVLTLPVSTTENAGALADEALLQSAAALDALAAGRIEARVAVLVGLGKHFSVGGNVRAFHEAEDTAGLILDTARNANALVTRLAALEIPVVAAAKGAVAGGAIGLCLSADIVVGGTWTGFAFAYSALGLSPDCGISYFLPRIVGRQRAATLLITSAQLRGEEARDLGLLSRWVGDDDVEQEAFELAESLAHGPGNSYASIKHLLATAESGSLDAVLREERFLIAANSETENGREGVAAFVEKRRPEFR